MNVRRPNVLIILTDQWRAQSTGYNGDPNVRTPRLDALALQSANFTNAVSGAPVCCAARASLITGQYPLQHGVYLNDVELKPTGTTLGESFRDAGYRTGYIGKWHLHGSPDGHYGRREAPVPADKQFGFDYWKGAECTHEYNRSSYYEGASPDKKYWPGYDAYAQTDDACAFIADNCDQPYLLTLSYGPPHFPLETAPDRHRALYEQQPMQLRANVPPELTSQTEAALQGYAAHIAALDECVGQLLDAVERSGTGDDTIVVFTSDHGDMMGSQGIRPEVKCLPWEESIRVPLLIRYPRRWGRRGRHDAAPINSPDLMPTLLGLCGLEVPASVRGTDALGPRNDHQRIASFIGMPVPFLWSRSYGIGEYRGLRTTRHTYIRSRGGPWLLYDNITDPYQLHNLCDEPEHAGLLRALDGELDWWLAEEDDEFLPASAYLRRDGLEHYFEVNNPIGSSVGPVGSWTSTMLDTDQSR